MSTTIGIMGESGHGKSTAIRKLDPTSTYIIDADKKGLPFRKWKTFFNSEQKNYIKTSDAQKIKQILIGISNKANHIKTIIVDTVNAIMVDDEMSRMKEKGYDKWQDLAISVYDLIGTANELRDDLIVVFMFHIHDIGEEGQHFYHILTNGKKLDKIKLESKMPIVLFAKCIDDEYVFETQANKSTAKSPMGMFEDKIIPNDLNFVIKKIKEYEK